MVDFPASYVGVPGEEFHLLFAWFILGKHPKKNISQVEGDGQVHDKYINQNIILREAQHTPVSHTPGIPWNTPKWFRNSET